MVAGVLLAAPWPGRVPELIGCGRAREHFLDIRAVNEFSRKFVRGEGHHYLLKVNTIQALSQLRVIKTPCVTGVLTR